MSDYGRERRARRRRPPSDDLLDVLQRTCHEIKPSELKISYRYVAPKSLRNTFYCYVFAINVATRDLGLAPQQRKRLGSSRRTWVMKIGAAVDPIRRGTRLLAELSDERVYPHRFLLLRVLSGGHETEGYLKRRFSDVNLALSWTVEGRTEFFLADPILAACGWDIPKAAPTVPCVINFGYKRLMGRNWKGLSSLNVVPSE